MHSNRRRHSWVRFLVALAVIFPAAPVTAAEPKARELYEQGAQAYREARYEAAIELLLRAYRLEPHAELNHDLGRAYEGAGDLERAIASFREYLRLEPNAKDRAVVEVRIQNLERRLAASQPRVSVTSNPAGATVAIDDRVVGTTPYAGTISPGAHRIDVRKAGHRPVSRDLRLGEAQQTELVIELEALPAIAARTAPPAEPERRAKVSLPAWIALGVGVGALGTAFAFELARKGAEDSAEDAQTQLGHQENYRIAERNRDLARLFLGVGAAAAVTSGVLLYLDFSSERAPGPSVGQSGQRPAPAHLTVGVVGSGRF
jgi:tetratricopeptide (TPR) repeat protein